MSEILKLHAALAAKDAEISRLQEHNRILANRNDDLKSELAEKDANLTSAIARIATTNSWLKRMSELRWKDKTYAPNFKKSVQMNDEFLAKFKKESV